MSAISSWGRIIVTTHAVALRLTPSLGIECKFWLGDDGWTGSSEHPSITVRAASFEHAKLRWSPRLANTSDHLWRQAGQSINGRQLERGLCPTNAPASLAELLLDFCQQSEL